MKKQQNIVQAVGQTLSYDAGVLSKVIDAEGAKIAKAFKIALKDKKRVKAFLAGLVDDKLLAI
jgi:hypothetical protein